MMQFILVAWIPLGLVATGSPKTRPAKLTAPELIYVFRTNAAAVDEYYLDKKVIVSGKLLCITRDYSPQNCDSTGKTIYAMWVELEKVGKSSDMNLVLLFDEKHRKQLAKLKRNDQVAVKGICKRLGQSVTVELLDCTLCPQK